MRVNLTKENKLVPLESESARPEFEINLKVKGGLEVARLLDYIAKTAAPGHSFAIVVDPDDKETRKTFGIDGDGGDYIGNIRYRKTGEKQFKNFVAE